MNVIARRCRSVGKQTRCTPAQFRVFPITIGRNFGQLGRDGAFKSKIVNERAQESVNGRQNTPTGNSAADLHEWDQREGGLGAIEPNKVVCDNRFDSTRAHAEV